MYSLTTKLFDHFKGVYKTSNGLSASDSILISFKIHTIKYQESN